MMKARTVRGYHQEKEKNSRPVESKPIVMRSAIAITATHTAKGKHTVW
jgi:hypothetical protein